MVLTSPRLALHCAVGFPAVSSQSSPPRVSKVPSCTVNAPCPTHLHVLPDGLQCRSMPQSSTAEQYSVSTGCVSYTPSHVTPVPPVGTQAQNDFDALHTWLGGHSWFSQVLCGMDGVDVPSVPQAMPPPVVGLGLHSQRDVSQ